MGYSGYWLEVLRPDLHLKVLQFISLLPPTLKVTLLKVPQLHPIQTLKSLLLRVLEPPLFQFLEPPLLQFLGLPLFQALVLHLLQALTVLLLQALLPLLFQFLEITLPQFLILLAHLIAIHLRSVTHSTVTLHQWDLQLQE